MARLTLALCFLSFYAGAMQPLPPCARQLADEESANAFSALWAASDMHGVAPPQVEWWFREMFYPYFRTYLSHVKLYGHLSKNCWRVIVCSDKNNHFTIASRRKRQRLTWSQSPANTLGAPNFVGIDIQYFDPIHTNADDIQQIFEALRAWAKLEGLDTSQLPKTADEAGIRLQLDEGLNTESDLAWTKLPGAIPFSKIQPGRHLHPALGWIEILGTEPRSDGVLRYHMTKTAITALPDQNHIHIALSGTPASRALLRVRAEEVMPFRNFALLTVVHALTNKKGGIRRFHLGDNDEIGKLGAQFREKLIRMGVSRLDELESREMRLELLKHAVEFYRTYGVDLARAAAIDFFARPFESRGLPHLYMKRGEWKSQRLPLAADLHRVKEDVTTTHFQTLYLEGIGLLADELDEMLPAKDQETLEAKKLHEHQFGRGVDRTLTLYYTDSHPAHGHDPFTRHLVELETAPSLERAARLVKFAKNKLAKEQFDPTQFDAVVFVPGSNPADVRNRSYYLAKGLAQTWSLPFLEDVFKIGAAWGGRAQKEMNGIVPRLENAALKFESLKPNNIAGKRILLIEDVNTAGVTLARVRSLLYFMGNARHVTVVSIAHSVSDANSRPGSLRSYPAEDFN